MIYSYDLVKEASEKIIVDRFNGFSRNKEKITANFCYLLSTFSTLDRRKDFANV